MSGICSKHQGHDPECKLCMTVPLTSDEVQYFRGWREAEEARTRNGWSLVKTELMDLENQLAEIGERVGKLLHALGHTVSTGESCTGGLVFDTLTNTPGSSAWCVAGIAAYTWEAKHRLLSVYMQTLRQCSAESEDVVYEMALGAARNTESTWGIATSGFAGPGGGTEKDPVGTVYLAVVRQDMFIFSTSKRISLGQRPRREIKLIAAYTVLHMLLEALENYNGHA